MSTNPTFQLQLLEGSDPDRLLKRVNDWLKAAAPDTQVVDRQFSVIPVSSTTEGPGVTSPLYVVAIWYTSPPSHQIRPLQARPAG